MEIRIDKNVEKFIESLEETTFAKVIRTINLLEKFEYKLGLPHAKKVDKSIFELRIRGQQEVRIFYAFHKNEIILLHSYVKKSQKIPKRELEYAIKQLRALI